MAEEECEGVGLPQKGLNMIIKDALPEMRIANETRELLNQCCVEFIKHVSREAQLISSKDQRKTIYHDHVQKALKNLGFPREYVDAANSVLGECKIAAEKRLKRKNSRLDKCGIPEEQLWQMQQRLIEQARRSEAEKQQQMAGQFGGGIVPDFFQQQQADNVGQFGTEWPQQQQPAQFAGQFQPPPPAPAELLGQGPPIANAIPALPLMMMPFGLDPQQLIVPSSSSNMAQFGAAGPGMMDPQVAAAAQLLFQKEGGGGKMEGAKEGGAGQKQEGEGQDEDEDEDEEEDYDV